MLMAAHEVSRRVFVRMAAISGGGLAIAACGGGSSSDGGTATTAGEAAEGATTTAGSAAPAGEDVILDIMSPVAEYEGPYREIWNLFESQHEGIKVNLFSVNEDTAAAHEAKVAGGYLPAIEHSQELQIIAGADNFETFVDLSSFDFEWWDRWTWDVQGTWSGLFGESGPRTLSPFQGFVFTWQWNQELMDQAGLDPQNDVKTWDDMKAWLDEGTAWAAGEDGKTFWSLAWHNWVFGVQLPEIIPMAFADGTRDRTAACWLGDAKFNDDDSPYRHFYDFFVEANEKGWMPEGLTTRQWEGDMEASYIAGDSALLLHGPWVWDKAMAAGADFAVAGNQAGMPLTPPADGQPWLQAAAPPAVDVGYFIRTGNPDTPHWAETQVAWNWMFSPEVIPLRASAEGRAVTYQLDELPDIAGPQFQQVLSEIGTSGGKWADTSFSEDFTGEVLAAPAKTKGSVGVFDWEANGNNQVMADVLSGVITVQDALDIAQKNWEASYEF